MDGRFRRKSYGYAFGLPDRHPTGFCGAVRCPSSSAWFPFGVSGEGGGAWWFENWIVDASNRKHALFLFAYRDFAKLFIVLSLVSRSIVL